MVFDKIYIEITNVCNLACSFCPKDSRKKEYMKVQDFEKIINQIKDYTGLICLHVKGEPLLHPELDSILQVCDKNNVKVNITTNATMLLKKIDVLVNHNSIRQLNLSIHSMEQNCKNGNEINEYLESIYIAVRRILNDTNIFVSYRLWSNNSRDMFLKLANQYDFSDIDNVNMKDGYVKLEDKLYVNFDEVFEWPNTTNGIISQKGTCLGTRKQLGILVDGTVVPCCLDEDGNVKLGNIFEERFIDILQKDRYLEMKQGFEQNSIVEELCQKCGYRKRFD